ncbi:ankyrin repeat-containing BDA1-like [Olea europaea subsp. europaea]|uniref:Ankyrin repeat-containing BDA1-like n=1 Tax=Olea europaea subsp. europaea TaxID=158383 RepID=A0A8S0QGQ6_OLEEU|nr:ankyrin repeat-containing BDA1-like [Olea europaea subsp. europaea]
MNTVEDLDIVHLYTKIRDNPHYLEVLNEMPFVESPLHTVASEGRTNLAFEILRLKPSLGKKLNLDGLCPLHLALDNGHTNTVKRLVKHDPDLVRVPRRAGNTLLKTNNTLIFRRSNDEGNTVMHLAALTNQSQVMKSLIKYVQVNKKNVEGKTVLDILSPENVEARKILISAGAKEGSSLVDDDTRREKYLKSNCMVEDIFMRIGAYLEVGLSGDMHQLQQNSPTCGKSKYDFKRNRL